MPDLTHDYMQTKAKALARNSEYINVKLFDAVNYNQNITSSSKLIMCYDPNTKDPSSLLWLYQNTSITDKTVLASYKVRVINATIKFTKSLT